MKCKRVYNLTVVNSLDICRGLFTRVNNKNTMEKSILDYVLVSNDLVSWIVGLQIDEGKLFTPWRKLKGIKDSLIIMQCCCPSLPQNHQCLLCINAN